MYAYTLATTKPSYGEPIDMLDAAQLEAATSKNKHISMLLLQNLRQKYKHLSVGRPEHFYDTVCRIAAPTRPSVCGEAKLVGSPLAIYRKRAWVPNKGKKQGI